MNKANGTTLLFIEDDDKVRDLYSKIFEMRGYRVIEAVNGDDAVEKFREHQDQIRVVISDVMMPMKDGRETFEEIRKIDKDVRVIFTSGYHSELNKRLKNEGHHYLQKPFIPQDLLKMIAEVLKEEAD